MGILVALLVGTGFASIQIINTQDEQAPQSAEPSLANTKGSLDFNDAAFEAWAKNTYGNTISTTELIKQSNSMWEYHLLDENGTRFYKIRMGVYEGETEEEFNRRIDYWTKFWLEYEYKKANPQDVNKAGRDYSLGK